MTSSAVQRSRSPGLWPRLRRGAWLALDLILPPECGGCGRRGERFCSACRASLALLAEPVCARCGNALPPTPDRAALCRNCRASSSALTGIRSVALFEGSLRRALHALKYRRDLGLAEALAELMAAGWNRWALAADVILPVPLSAQRQRERGYNQAALLARALADHVGAPLDERALARIRHTASQVTLTAEERKANVADAFAARAERIRGRGIVVVDDVCTTGATLEACAEALRLAGAAEVWGFTLARAP